MNVYRNFEHKFTSGAVVVVGSFDGVHAGHRHLLDLVSDCAQQRGMEPVVVTFEPHPRLVLRGENRLLTTLDEKLELMRRAGVKNVVVVNFTHEFAALSAKEFVGDMLVERIGARVIFAADGHTFGKDREGSKRVMEDLGLEVVNIHRVGITSSTLVRQTIENGEMELAAEQLSAPYMVKTPVCESTKLLPPRGGEYLCEMEGEQMWMSVSQITEITEPRTIYIKKKLGGGENTL